MHGKRIGSVCATGLALVLTSHAYAQAPAHPEATAATAHTETPEIVVTARRRAESLQDVPQSITAFSLAQLATANVTRVDDLARIAPGFVVQPSPLGSQALTVTLRSQRQNLPNLTYDPSVVIYSPRFRKSARWAATAHCTICPRFRC